MNKEIVKYQFPYTFEHIEKKGWGKELWVTNNEQYCGKILEFEQGKKCSFHKHSKKNEHFHLLSGKMVLRVGWNASLEESQEFLLEEGQSYHIPTGLYHQMEALTPSRLLEFSTTHYEDDSYRSVKGD